jgi:hypothetical protein
MPRQRELAFIKTLSTFQVSMAVLKELRMALPRRKKKPLLPPGIRMWGSSSQLAANAKPTS